MPTVTIGQMLLDSNENIILIDPDKVYISIDKGSSWQLKAKNLKNPITSKYDQLYINTQNVIYLKTYTTSEFFYSLDLGLSWTKFVPNGLDNSNTLYLTSNNTFVWESYDSNNYNIRYSTDFLKLIMKYQLIKTHPYIMWMHIQTYIF